MVVTAPPGADLRDRRVLVTGGASGIGRAIGEGFAKAGARVALLDRDAATLATTVAGLEVPIWLAAGDATGAVDTGDRHLGVACDVADEGALEAAIDRVTATFGGVDVLVGNAGFQQVAPIEAFPSEVFRHMLDVMVVAPFVALRRLLPGMRARRWGRVIHIASVNGLVGFAGKAGYNTAKHALIGLTRVAALEVATDGVTVNALCPGYVDTPLVRGQLQDLARTRGVEVERVLDDVIYPLVPQRRLLEVAEVVAYVLFLSGEGARGVTGQAVVLDGGYTAQ